MDLQEKTTNMLAQERTLLSAERTFAAWIRTAIAAMAGGVAILRLITFKTDLHRIVAHIIGEMLIAWGLLLIAMALFDYKAVCDSFGIDHYKNSYLRLAIIAVPLLIIIILLIWITLP